MRALLMGGQACVVYGGAEFSRDTDLIVLGDSENLAALERALKSLNAERIAVPPFEPRYLELGLAVHFRCHAEAARGMRVDVMTRLRGLDPFTVLWDRRSTFEMPGGAIDVLSLPDLVLAKKTQRDKDWPMLTRLVDADYLSVREDASQQQIDFWLRELRTPRWLIEASRRWPDAAHSLARQRPLLEAAVIQNEAAMRGGLDAEEQAEREADARYWAPLRRELQRLRHDRA